MAKLKTHTSILGLCLKVNANSRARYSNQHKWKQKRINTACISFWDQMETKQSRLPEYRQPTHRISISFDSTGFLRSRNHNRKEECLTPLSARQFRRGRTCARSTFCVHSSTSSDDTNWNPPCMRLNTKHGNKVAIEVHMESNLSL